MRWNTTLGSLALAGLCALPSIGCVVRGHAQVVAPAPVAVVEVEEEPPPPRAVVVETRPGFVWIEGRYERRGRQWAWIDGRWERERAGHVWVQGRWERRGNRHVWVEGRWEAHATVNDHRGEGPVIRDHRH
jgi:YXWGXW repeat-containing protein